MRVIAVADHDRHGQRLMTIGVGEFILHSRIFSADDPSQSVS